MPDPKTYLAQTLKELRQSKGLSLDKAAQATGVSKAMLGQIERAESSPTVAVLWKIATGLKIPMTRFIEPVPLENQKAIIRTADHIRQNPAEEGLKIAPLFPYEKRFGFEYSELTFIAGFHRISEPHESGVVEHITIIEGSMEILSEGTWHSLRKGQSIRFRGDKEHGYRNQSQDDCVVLIIIHYPHQLNETEDVAGSQI